MHHLYRRSEGGADHPKDVIALCSNCHRRVQHGRNGGEFNQN
nr:HNH endonuclease [Haloterrigena salifodinae]